MTVISVGNFFFSWRVEHGLPYVVNFYLRSGARTFRNARNAAKLMMLYFKLRGARKIILNTLVRRDYLRRLVEFQFKVKPYATGAGHHYYLVEVK